MQFREDLVEDFINYKLSNPQALQEEMKMIQDRQDCTRKLNEYAKQMENLKNEYNMCKELLEVSTAKRDYLQQTFQPNKEQLDAKIVYCKEEFDNNNREVKERQIKNQYNRKRYNDFQKEIAVKKDKLTEYHLTELTILSNHSENLKKNIEQKREKKEILEEELKTLKDRQKIIQESVENSQIIKNKWLLKRKQLQKLRQEQTRKQKQIRDQINNAISMQKVIYGNFYKRCAQITMQMQSGIEDLFLIDWMTIEGSNLDQKVQKLLQLQRVSKQKLFSYIGEKREKYKINADLPEADAEVYNNIVETKINPSILKVINPSVYHNNDVLLKEIEDGLEKMFQKLEEEKKGSLERQSQKISEINELHDRVREFEAQIQSKRKQLLSPSKRSKKNI